MRNKQYLEERIDLRRIFDNIELFEDLDGDLRILRKMRLSADVDDDLRRGFIHYRLKSYCVGSIDKDSRRAEESRWFWSD